MSDTTSAGGPERPGAAPTEEQVRQYLAALRTAPVQDLVTELLFGLLNAAQAKLGRRDARLLIDLSGGMVDHLRPYLSADVVRQLDQALTQLRLGQVKAEEKPGGPEPNDLSQVPTPPARTGAPATPAPTTATADASRTAPAGPTNPASRLWVPGRDF